MAAFQSTVFTKQKVMLDGNSYLQCKFEEVVLVYSGGPMPDLIECTFNRNVSWEFQGGALAFIDMLKALHNGGFGSMVEQLCNEICGRAAVVTS